MSKNHFSQITAPISTKLFGVLPDSREVYCHTLCNKNGCELSVIDYGATITALKIPITDGSKTDVVLGFASLEDYIHSFDLPSAPYLGAVVGRYAGRINNGTFTLNNSTIQLSKNWNSHQIHGGHVGFSQKLWTVTAQTAQDNPSITLAYISEDKEEHFPGELQATVTYTLSEDNEVTVTFTATSSEATPINLTQHSYFNLEGHSKEVTGQKLLVSAGKILETTNEMIPTGQYVALNNHPFDFSVAKNCPKSIDSTFVLDHHKAATLFSETTGIKMTVITNQPAVHIYVGGNCFGKIKGKENADYHTLSGICFETQNFPDAPNHSHFPNAILKKGEEYRHETLFKFENL